MSLFITSLNSGSNGNCYYVGNLSITAFPKFHDAADPCSFIVSYNKTKVGVFTDIGTPCKNVIDHFKQCHAAFLESNYDEVMLEQGQLSLFFKKPHQRRQRSLK